MLAQELKGKKTNLDKENGKVMQNFLAKLINKQQKQASSAEANNSDKFLKDPLLQKIAQHTTGVTLSEPKKIPSEISPIAAAPQSEITTKPGESSFTKHVSNIEEIPQKMEEKKFEKLVEAGKMPSIIAGEGNSSFIDGNSFTFPIEGGAIAKEGAGDVIDEYVDDDDPGFELYEIYEEYFETSCKQLATRFGFPARSIKPESKKVESKTKDIQKTEEKSRDENNISTESKRSKRPPKDSTPGDDDSVTFDHKEKLKNPDRRELASKDEKKGGMTKTASEGELRPSSSTANLDEVIKKVKPEHTNLLPKRLKFPTSEDGYYPVECEGIVYDCFSLKVIISR